MEDKKQFSNVNEYINSYPDDIKEKLQKMRDTIKECAPEAEEVISWGMPTYKLNGNLVHFAGHKNHIGFYPGPSPINVFKDELINFKTSKGAIQFPLDKKIPYDLIIKIVKFRVKENTNL